MNHFCVDRNKTKTLQLKVCEGCGALWLRPQNRGIYCRSCTEMLADFPTPRRPRGMERERYAKRREMCRVLPMRRSGAAVDVVMTATTTGDVSVNGGAR